MLLDIIIKFNLLKIELCSSILREFYFLSFLNNLIDKLNVSNINKINIEETINKIKEIKNKNELVENEN